MTTEDRRVGKQLPSPVTPPTTVCFTIQVPNAVQYRAAFLGQLNILGDWHTWDHPTDGTNCINCEEAAQLWRTAIYEATWSDECGIPMSCDDVADCIENDPGTRAAVTAAAASTATPGTTSTPGEPMTPAQYNANLTPTDDCDPDVLWAQTEQLVDYVISAGLDLLEQIEIYTNGIEAVQFVEMIPILGTLFDEAQIDQVVAFLDWTVEVLSEIFMAADTAENRIAIKCAIFCATKDDCTITIQKLWEIENERLGGILDPSDINSVETLLTAIVALGTNPALPLDVWFTFTIAMAKLAGYLGVRGIDFSLNLLLKLAVNDANNDWELLCEDCPPPPATGPWILWTERIAQPVGTLTQSQEPDGLSGTVSVVASLGGDGIYRAAVFSPGTGVSGCKTITSASGYSPNTYSEQGCTGIAGAFTGGGYMDRIYIANNAPFTFEFTWSA